MASLFDPKVSLFGPGPRMTQEQARQEAWSQGLAALGSRIFSDSQTRYGFSPEPTPSLLSGFNHGIDDARTAAQGVYDRFRRNSLFDQQTEANKVGIERKRQEIEAGKAALETSRRLGAMFGGSPAAPAPPLGGSPAAPAPPSGGSGGDTLGVPMPPAGTPGFNPAPPASVTGPTVPMPSPPSLFGGSGTDPLMGGGAGDLVTNAGAQGPGQNMKQVFNGMPPAWKQAVQMAAMSGKPENIASIFARYAQRTRPTDADAMGYKRFRDTGERVFPDLTKPKYAPPQFDENTGAFYQTNPTSGKRESVPRAQSGMSVTAPDGTKIEFGGAGGNLPNGLQKTTQAKIEKDLLALQGTQQRLTEIAAGFRPEFHQYGTRFKNELAAIREKGAGIIPSLGLSESDTAELQAYTDYHAGLAENFALALNDLSGVAINPAEYKRAEAFMPNINDSPSQIQGKIQRMQRFTRNAVARMNYAKNNGFKNVHSVPLSSMGMIINKRGRALEKSGLDKAAVLERLGAEFGLPVN